MKVSCLILTHNEAINIASCLAALAFCDDIVVLDSGSTDDTVAIAHAFGARILTRPFDNFANQRNFGLEHGDFRHDWVLHLDADEIVTPGFVAALEALSPPSNIMAFNVPSKTMLFGHWLRHAGMYPTYQVRLGRQEQLRFVQVGHGQREDLAADCVGVFDEPYLHYSFSHGLEHWFAKHIRYAREESDLIIRYRAGALADGGSGDRTVRRRQMKALAAHIPVIFRPFARFMYIYFYRQGFRDGKAGLIYAMMLAVYEGMTAVFVLQRRVEMVSNATASTGRDNACPKS